MTITLTEEPFDIESSIYYSPKKEKMLKTGFIRWFFEEGKIITFIGATGSGKTTINAFLTDLLPYKYPDGKAYWIVEESKIPRMQKYLPPWAIATTNIMDHRILPSRKDYEEGTAIPHPKLICVDEAGTHLKSKQWGTDYAEMIASYMSQHRQGTIHVTLGDQRFSYNKDERDFNHAMVFLAMSSQVEENVKKRGGFVYRQALRNPIIYNKIKQYAFETKEQKLLKKKGYGKAVIIDYHGRIWDFQFYRPKWYAEEVSLAGQDITREDIIQAGKPRNTVNILDDLPLLEETEIHQEVTRAINTLCGWDHTQKPDIDLIKAQFYRNTGRKPPPLSIVKESMIIWLAKTLEKSFIPEEEIRNEFVRYLKQLTIVSKWENFQGNNPVLEKEHGTVWIPNYVVKHVAEEIGLELTYNGLKKILDPLMIGSTRSKKLSGGKVIQCWVFSLRKMKL